MNPTSHLVIRIAGFDSRIDMQDVALVEEVGKSDASGGDKDYFDDAPLVSLVSAGNKAYLFFEDQSGTFEEKDQYLKEYIRLLSEWELVSSKTDADFIIYVKGYSRRTARSFTSDTYFMSAEIRRLDGSVVWKGDEVSTFANLRNHFRAVRAVSKELVEDMVRDIEEEKRKSK